MQTLYVDIYSSMRVQMKPLFSQLITLALGGLLIATGWIALYHWQPTIPALIFHLLSQHPWLTGIWLGLSVIGLDYALVSIRNAIGYRNVGAKARAHWRLGGEQ